MAIITVWGIPMCDNDCENCTHYNDEIELCDYDPEYYDISKEYYENEEYNEV